MSRQQPTPIPVARALRKLGNDIRDARRRRRIPTQVMAERAGIPVFQPPSLKAVATLLFILGLLDRLADVADVHHDLVGLDMADDLLPQRIRTKRRD